MGTKIELIGDNLLPESPTGMATAKPLVAPVSALNDAQEAKKYNDNKYDKLFSWETVPALANGLPEFAAGSILADKISPYIPEVKLTDSLSFGGGGPLITNSQPVTDERLSQYAKAVGIPTEYWQDLRDSKDMTEVYSKASRVLKDLKDQQHLSQAYGSTALVMGSQLFSPTWFLTAEGGTLLAASVKSASMAKSLAAAGALKSSVPMTKAAEAVSGLGKSMPNAVTQGASAVGKATESAIGKSGGFLTDTASNAAANILIGEIDADLRGRETTSKDLLLNGLVGGLAPHALKAGGWLFNRSVKAFHEIGAKSAQEKFNLEPTDKLNEMTLGEKVSHGDESIEPTAPINEGPKLTENGPAQGELFDSTGPHRAAPKDDDLVKLLLGEEPGVTEGKPMESPEQLELDYLGEPKRVPVENTEVTPVVSPEPVIEAEHVASPDVPAEVQTPKELLRARPSYTLDGVRFTPRFKSSIDKALFIVGQDARSAHDVKYMEMLRQVFPKLSDAEIREAGQGIKAQHMRGNAKVAIETKGLPRGTDAELPVDTTWKDNVNPIGKDHEPMTHEVGPVVPKEGLQPEQLKELEAATPEVQQKVVQKVLDEKVSPEVEPKDIAQALKEGTRDLPSRVSIMAQVKHLGEMDKRTGLLVLDKPVDITGKTTTGTLFKGTPDYIEPRLSAMDGKLFVAVREGKFMWHYVDADAVGKALGIDLTGGKTAKVEAPKANTTGTTPEVQQKVVQKALEQKSINEHDIAGAGEVANMVKGKPVSGDGFAAIEHTTKGPTSLYSHGGYKDPWGSGKSIPKAEIVKETKKPIRIVAVHPDPVLIPNEFFPESGDFAFFKVKAILPGKKTPQETLVKAWAFEGVTPPKTPKGKQSGFITPGVALGLLAGTGLGVYAVGQASQGKDLKETLGSALGGLMILGMTKGNKSVMTALEHAKPLSEVISHPDVKANPEAVTLHTADGQNLKLLDLVAKSDRLTDGTPFHMGDFKLPFVGKTRVADPTGELSAEIRNSDSNTYRALGAFISSSLAGHKTKGAMNHSTSDVYKQASAKQALYEAGNAFDKGFKEWANRDGDLTPDFIKAWSSKLSSEFNDLVVRAKKGETEGIHPAAVQAAKGIAKSEADMLAKINAVWQAAKAKGAVADGSALDVAGQLAASPTYVHRSPSSKGLYEMMGTVGAEKVHLLVQRAMRMANKELSDELAQELAPAYVKTLASLEHSDGYKVADMDPKGLIKHIQDVTKMTEEKASELSQMILQQKAKDGTSGFLKHKATLDDTFSMDTTDLQGNSVTISMKQLFQQDIRLNHASWVDSMSGILGMGKASLDFGADLTHGPTFQHFLDAGKAELLAKNIPYERAMKQVETLRDVHANILGKNNSTGIFKPSNEAIRLLNDMTTLLSHGNFVFSAAGELAAAVQRRGLENVLHDMPELTQVVKAAINGDIEEGLARAIVSSHALGDHQTAALQLSLEQGTLGAATGKVQLGIGQTAKANLFTPVTASTKYASIKGQLQVLSDVLRGHSSMTKSQWGRSALRGMDEALLARIREPFLRATAVDERGMLLSDGTGYRPDDFVKDDAIAFMELHAHLERIGQESASEPAGVGETNRYFHNDIGRTLGKFQGTPVNMWHKLKGNVNNFDSAVAASWITTSMAAALAYIMTTYLNNHGDKETLKKKLTNTEIAKAAFRNGSSGIAPNVIDLASTMLGQGPVFAGVTNSGRQGGVDVPAFRTIQRVKDTAALAGHALTGQQVTRSEAAQAAKTPLWAVNAFIPFATAPLPKKREAKSKD